MPTLKQKASALFSLDPIKQAIHQLTDQRKIIEAKLEELKREREDLLNLPVAKSDLIAGLDNWVDRISMNYRERIAVNLKRFAARPREADKIGSYSHSVKPELFCIDHRGIPYPEKVPEDALVFLFGEQIKDVIQAEIKALDLPDEGPVFSERNKQVERLDREIEQMEATLETLKEAAKESGMYFR